MKVLRVMVGILAGILLCFGIFLYSAHKAVKDIAVEGVMEGVVDEVSNVILQPEFIEEVMGTLPDEVQGKISDISQKDLPPEVQNKIEDVKSSILEDPKINELSQTYMDAILGGAIQGNAKLPDINQDIQDVVKDHAEEIAAVGGKELSEEKIAELTNKITEKIDLQPKLEQAIEKVNKSITPSQKQLLGLIQEIQSPNMNLGAILLMVASLITIVLCSWSFYKWLLYAGICGSFSGLIIVLGSKFADSLIGSKLDQLGDMFSSMKDLMMGNIASTGIMFLGIGVVMMILYVLISFVKRHVVYE